MRFIYKKSLGALLLAPFISLPVSAGDSWFSEVHEEISYQPAGARLARARSSDSTISVFDIVISLEANPLGDDDASNDTPGDEDQRKYEAVIKEFADGVCQATNTAHKLGVVRVFRKLEQKTSADITWDKQCASNDGPWAHPTGFGKTGWKIHMCDNWSGAGPSNPLIDHPKPAGFTLAHEWGHYTYGLYDEYVGGGTTGGNSSPRSTDTGSSPSIMNNQWCAAGGSCPPGFTSPDLDFLEFSTSNIAPFSGGGGTNAQLRMYGISAWDTLVQSPNSDPKCAVSNSADCPPARTRYTNLSAVKPPVSGDFTVNNSEASCQDSLDIRWMQEDMISELVIDRSGSMSGGAITNAKIGANLLIAQLPTGKSAVGVASFAGSPSQNFQIQDIPEPDTGVKAAAQSAVNGLVAGGSTALFDGLVLGLDNTLAFANASTNPDRVKVVYVLADGDDNSSSATSSSVIASYRAADVPIIALGYGSGAPTSVLQTLASATGGKFINSPTTLAEILQAFTAANAAVSSSVIINNEKNSVAAASSFALPLLVDSTLGDIFISLTYIGDINDIEIALLDADGNDTGVVFVCEVASNAIACGAKVEQDVILANLDENYTLEVTNNSSGALELSSIITGNPASGGDSYDIAIGTTGGSEVTYPQEARVTATVSRSALIAGLAVSATVTSPSGQAETISLFDDGTHGDTFPQDGTYSALINYTMSGIYTVRVTVDNSAGTGVETTLGSLMAPPQDGSTVTPGLGVPITENFSRIASTQFNVVGFRADDHANDINSGNCTIVTDDNADTHGQIDFANDVDCFTFFPSNPGAALAFRVTGLSNEMIPVMSIFDSAGNKLSQVESDSPEGGVVITVPTPDEAGMFFTVMHKDPSAVIGGYDVSVGEKIFSDFNRKQLQDINTSLAVKQFIGKKDRDLLEDAVFKINQANNDLLWNNDNDSLTSRGADFFAYINTAVSKLNKISDRDAVASDIDNIISIVKQITHDAIALSTNARYQRKAQSLYDLAQSKLDDGKITEAIYSLQKAWSIASR